MEAQENKKLKDELLPELEMGIIASKLTDSIKVDLHGLDENFITFLVSKGFIENGDNNDVQIMALSKFPKFCRGVRDLYRSYIMENPKLRSL